MQNTLSLEQVTAVLNGKHVLSSPKDIAEVKNAYEIYERLEELDPYSVPTGWGVIKNDDAPPVYTSSSMPLDSTLPLEKTFV